MQQDYTSPSGSTSQKSSSSTATDDVGKAKDALVEGATHLKDDVKHAASEAATQAKKAAESKIDAGRDFAAEQLGSVADALRKAGDELRKSDSAVTDYATKAASAVDQVSYYLQSRTLSHVIGDLEGFARREPAMFLGGAFVAGLFGGRFLKAATPAPTVAKGAGQQGRSLGEANQSGRPAALPAYTGYRGYESPSYESTPKGDSTTSKKNDATAVSKDHEATDTGKGGVMSKGASTSKTDTQAAQPNAPSSTKSGDAGNGNPPLTGAK